MRLVCTIGSMHILNPRTVLKRGDEFEIDDLKGSSLIAHGYAMQTSEMPAEDPVPETVVTQKTPPPKKRR